MKNQLSWAYCLMLFFFLACKAETRTEKADDTSASKDSTSTTMAPAEFADPKYADLVRSGMDAFSRGDVASWMNYYADNAVYVWNNGDSIVGKTAISDYWTNRMANVIDTLVFSNAIYLPIKVNKPQSVEQPGIWVLGWYQTHATYSTGKSMTQWIHTDTHFDANGKYDRVISYMDRALINAAMTK